MLRTYNVPDGTLFVDGQDVNTLSIHSVRAACAYVPQDNFLFSDTIAHNIGFGVDDAGQADIDRAAALADVRDNIVDFKDGYETVLGERGVTVSGGQKQRISIARALLKNAPILILDDSVSAVDTRTEKIILDNLKSSRANKTTLLIAHRISTVERLDKIIFLNDEGRVEAVGPHDELYATCAEYRRMVDLQRLEDETKGRRKRMMHLNPLVLVGAVIGVITALLVAAYAAVKDKKTAMGFERTMADGEILRRLSRYARPTVLSKFLIVGLLMLFSIAYDIISPPHRGPHRGAGGRGV